MSYDRWHLGGGVPVPTEAKLGRTPRSSVKRRAPQRNPASQAHASNTERTT